MIHPTDFDYRFGFAMPDSSVYTSGQGLTEEVVRNISAIKKEPSWMLDFRLRALAVFRQKKLPSWGPDLSNLNLDLIRFYQRPVKERAQGWDDLPYEIRETYRRIGVPEAERRFLAGVSAQYDSEVVYESAQKELKKKGVIFCNMDSAVKLHPRLVRQYMGTVVPSPDNIFSALNSTVWSGGSFIYVPKGVEVGLPLQAYFRINAEALGQFERTLIIADEGSRVHYIEGCTAPIYHTDSLHAAVVEILVKKGAQVRYTTVQNWSKNVYNLVTKRAIAESGAHMEWVDCNIGSKITMKYPAIHLIGPGAKGEVLSIAYAGSHQVLDAGAKIFHKAPDTSSRVVSKSISKDGGRSSYRGMIEVSEKAKRSKVYVSCDAMILDSHSRSDTYPTMNIHSGSAEVQHEATVERLGEEKLFYLMSRGISKSESEGLLVNGFIQPVSREIPLEYSIELNRLINLEMEGSVG